MNDADDTAQPEFPVEGDAAVAAAPALDPDAEYPAAPPQVVGQPESSGHDDDGEYGKGPVLAGWVYLALLFAVFVGLAIAVFALPSGDSDVAAPTVTVDAPDAALTPVGVTIEVGETVTLAGTVPDQATVDQLVALVEARYPDQEISNELVIDDSYTLDGGTVTVSGTAIEGDPRPDGIASDVAAALNLVANPSEVVYEAEVLTPVALGVELNGETATLSGDMPDDESRAQFVAVVADTWGSTVDDTGLGVGDALTTEGGTVTVTGTLGAGDLRGALLESNLLATFGTGLNVNTDGIEIDTSPEALAELEDQLRTQLAANPILFESGSAVIDAESEAIVEQVAAAINLAPGIDVEIVGHTDNTGSDEINQQLSEDRAAAVLDRLVELGVDDARLSSRGAGSSEPIASNDTAEGQAENRRIEFLFGDQSTDGEAAEDDETTTTTEQSDS